MNFLTYLMILQVIASSSIIQASTARGSQQAVCTQEILRVTGNLGEYFRKVIQIQI